MFQADDCDTCDLVRCSTLSPFVAGGPALVVAALLVRRRRASTAAAA
jgi:hypothetical protein